MSSTARDLPEHLKVAFEPATVGTDASESLVTVTSEAGSVAGSHTITLVGTSGGKEKTTPLSIVLQTITVEGNVQGTDGITVVLVGRDPVVTANKGKFVFTDVTPPYDLYTYREITGSAGNDGKYVHYYDDLTRPDPTVITESPYFLLGISACIGGTKNGNVAGTISGGGGFDASHGTLVRASRSSTELKDPAGGAFNLPVSWCTAAGVKVYALNWTKKAVTNAPDTYTGSGFRDITAASGGTVTADFALGAVETAALTGTIGVPANFSKPTVTLTQKLYDQVFELFKAANYDAVAVGIPVLPNAATTLFATTSLGKATVSYTVPNLSAATDVAISLPAPPETTSPAGGATNVAKDATLSFNGPPSSVRVLRANASGIATQSTRWRARPSCRRSRSSRFRGTPRSRGLSRRTAPTPA